VPPLVVLSGAEPPVAPRLGVMRTPLWDRIDADARAAFDRFAERLGAHARAAEWPHPAHAAIERHRTIMEADIAASFGVLYDRASERLSASLRGQIERGREIRAVDYRCALEGIAELNVAFDPLFDRCDAIVTPATLGTAPAGLQTTGDPILCTLWTYAGMPALSLPLLHGANGLPLGVQLVGRRHDDARLLRTAGWLERGAFSA
jgi:Asp-tRNA(Asn)/Glu-tRNA(Gln) amidotransferase A subunit family amidase